MNDFPNDPIIPGPYAQQLPMIELLDTVTICTMGLYSLFNSNLMNNLRCANHTVKIADSSEPFAEINDVGNKSKRKPTWTNTNQPNVSVKI